MLEAELPQSQADSRVPTGGVSKNGPSAPRLQSTVWPQRGKAMSKASWGEGRARGQEVGVLPVLSAMSFPLDPGRL